MATVPSRPSTPVISLIGPTSVHAKFSDGDNGGSPTNSRQLGYGTNPQVPTSIVSSDGNSSIFGLSPGTRYYIWARTHNAIGYSAWSGRSSIVTLRVPDVPSRVLFSNVTATTVEISFSPNGNGGTPITGYQIAYGVVSGDPPTIVAATSPKTVTGLAPGIHYNFRVRAQNSVGFSDWSLFTVVQTIAGAYVKVGLVWKQAIPFVRVGGVWKPAESWCRSVGEWKRTI